MTANAIRSFHSLVERLESAGFDRAFTHSTILPDWWDETCEEDPRLLPDFEFRTARFLDLPLETIQDPAAVLVQPHQPTTNKDVSPASIHAGIQIAQAVIRNLRDDAPAVLPPSTGRTWRAELLAGLDQPVALHTIVSDLWNRHIPVVPVISLPQPDFQTLGCVIQGRPLVMMSNRITDHRDAAVHTAHQIAHIIAGDCANNKIVTHRDPPDLSDLSEAGVNAFTREVIVDGTDGAMLPPEPATNPNQMGNLKPFPENVDFWVSSAPQKVIVLDFNSDIPKYRAMLPVRSILFNEFVLNVDVAAASDTDTNLLRCVNDGTLATPTH